MDNKPTLSTIALKWRWGAAGIAAILIVVSPIVWWTAHVAGIEMRENQLDAARLVSKAVNLTSILSLSGSDADLASPGYLRLKEQLALVRGARPTCRFVYLVGSRPDGTIFFFVDSEPAGSPDESPPGQVYAEAPKQLPEVFASGHDATSSYTDRWGTWISAFVPVRDPQSGKVIGVLGMDVDKRTWKTAIAKRCLIPVGLALVTIPLAAMFFALRASHRRIRIERQALQESEARLKTIMNATFASVLLIDEETCTILDANRQALRIIGASPERLIGQECHRFTGPLETEECPINDPDSSGNAGESILTTAEGRSLPILKMVTRVRIDGKRCLVDSFIDISERKAAETAVHEREKTLRAMTDAAQNAFLMMDPEGRISFYNPAAERIFGWTPDEAIGKDLHCLLTPRQYWDAHAKGFQHFKQTGEGAVIGLTRELTAVRKDGSEFPAELSLSSVLLGGQWHAVGVVRDFTERRRNEELLRESEKRFMDVIYVADDAILLIDHERFVDCNEATARMLGYSSREQFLMTHPSKLSPPTQPDGRGSFEKANEIMQTAFEKGFLRFEWVHRRANGEDLPVEVSLTPISYQGKAVLHCLWRDITERKRMEEALRQSEERHRMLFSSSRDAIMTLGPPAWRFTSANPACVAMFGAQDETDFISHAPWEFSPERQPCGRPSLELVKEISELALRQGSHIFEWRHNRLGGEEFTARVLLSRVEIGDYAFLQATVRDITQQKQMEETLRASEEKFRQIVDNIGLGVSLISPDLRILELNRQMRTWFPNIVPDAHLVCHHAFNSPPSETPCSYCPTVLTFQDGKVHVAMTTTPHEGGTRNFRVVSSPIHDHEGRVIAAIEMVEDMTDKLRLEQELSQAQKLEAVGRLAAGIAHEINTPTQYVGDNIEFLQIAYENIFELAKAFPPVIQAGREGQIPPPLLAQAEDLVENTNLGYLAEQVPRAIEQSLEGIGRIATIVQAMKEFSHPGVAEKTTVDLNQCIRNTTTVSRNEWKYVADLELDLDGGLPQVSCLPGELNQVFLNMIVNAAHAIGDVVGSEGASGKGTITIRTRRDGDWCEIRISDTGAGIPEDIRGRIFDPFFTTKEVGRGTGQGLAIARNVVLDKHGGTITVDSEVGKGTTFTIRLPLGG